MTLYKQEKPWLADRRIGPAGTDTDNDNITAKMFHGADQCLLLRLRQTPAAEGY